MDAMGQLTGGVAHDFNNLLTPIVGILDMLSRKGIGEERDQLLIDGALQSAERAKVLVQRLLAFARRQPLQPSPVDVGKLISGMSDLFASTAGPQVQILIDIEENLPSAMADANQVEMALLNLCINARDAMPDGGKLRVSASCQTFDDESGSGMRAGHYIRLSVADTGIGMDEQTAKQAVEPFFSTKGVGQGTGLGLSMVHGLAQQLGGGIAIQSELGIGTKIFLWLPITEKQPERSASTSQIIPQLGNMQTVLLVDDEELVRNITEKMLIELGYKVANASSGEQALNFLRNGLRPDVLITDHLMPGMNGTALAGYAQSSGLTTKVLLISGYAEAKGLSPDLPRLSKPFRQDELAAALASIGAWPSRQSV